MEEEEEPVRVGTTGTIGSLMLRELESMRRMEEKNNAARRTPRNDAVSISCGRPLASLAGYRLGTPKQTRQDSNTRSPVTPRSTSVSGKDSVRRGFEAATCRSKLGFGRQESLGRRMDYKEDKRKSVSVEEGVSELRGMLSEEESENIPATPPFRARKDRGGECRTPMLRTQGKDGDVCRKSVERRGSAPPTLCSFVEVVDIHCNTTDKIWGSPIASRLRRLSFSRLSESVN